jgi:DNA-directed RNA polymerase subunit RPC12/RpoP
MTFKLPNRDLTIGELIQHRALYIGIECRRCGHRAFLDAAWLRHRFGGEVRESQIRRALICNQCRRREFIAKPLPLDRLPRKLRLALSFERKEREEREARNRELKSE